MKIKKMSVKRMKQLIRKGQLPSDMMDYVLSKEGGK
jgi:hypothetical protein